MELYCNHIVDLLVNSPGIKPVELFQKSGIESKRDFIKEINRLITDNRIIKQYHPEYIKTRYSPKVLYLWEHEKNSEPLYNSLKNQYKIDFLPIEVLETELGYVNNGKE